MTRSTSSRSQTLLGSQRWAPLWVSLQWALAGSISLASSAALAQPPPQPPPADGPAAPTGPAVSSPPAAAAAPIATDEDAINRFKEGRRLLEAGSFDAALVELRASFERLPSPNTELLMGHALRLANRRAEAAATYRRVIASAGEKVRAGETRFQATLEEAGRLEATLRAQLVELDVLVTGADAGTTVTIDGETLPVSSNARGLTAKVLHEPGQLRIVATTADGRSAEQDLDGKAGAQSSILIALSAKQEAPLQADTGGVLDIPPPPLASWVAGGVGLAGFAVFGIFGAMSSSAASDLEACSPSCPESLRDTADGGASQQTIANVGLVFGALGVATAGVLWVVWPGDDDASGAAPAPKASVRVSPAGRADVRVRF